MRYVDGELPAREAKQLDKRLAAAASEDRDAVEDRARVAAMRQLGDVVRARYDLAADEAAPRLADMWSRLDRALASRDTEPVTLAARIAAWWHDFKSHVFVGAACAAAAALVVFLLMRRPDGQSEVVFVPTAPPELNSPPTKVMASEGEAESLEVEGTATVFRIPSEGDDEEAATTVIWITPDDSGSEGPI